MTWIQWEPWQVYIHIFVHLCLQLDVYECSCISGFYAVLWYYLCCLLVLMFLSCIELLDFIVLCGPPPLLSMTSVFYKGLLSFRSINNGCTETEYLYSSISASTLLEVLICSFLARYWYLLWTPSTLLSQSTYDPANPLSLSPVHEWTPINKCCHPLRLESECSSCWLEGMQLVDPTK